MSGEALGSYQGLSSFPKISDTIMKKKEIKSYSMLSATLKDTSAQEQDSCGPKSDGVDQVL